MRKPLSIVPLLILVACDGLSTAPVQLTLDELSPPPSNTAMVVLTEPLGDGGGDHDMSALTQYAYALRTPPPLPELIYETSLEAGTSALLLTLADIEQTGVLVTGTDDVDVGFVPPDGAPFAPRSTCRITITSAWADQAGRRLQGKSDCPVTDGTRELRVLFKFDYTVPAG
ncbi:MAG: hypothetical protein KY466_01435 [Gemmatimonadetes bacterium]|nr:hypothetical protein [Gemmatimonadota bacterium]